MKKNILILALSYFLIHKDNAFANSDQKNDSGHKISGHHIAVKGDLSNGNGKDDIRSSVDEKNESNSKSIDSGTHKDKSKEIQSKSKEMQERENESNAKWVKRNIGETNGVMINDSNIDNSHIIHSNVDDIATLEARVDEEIREISESRERQRSLGDNYGR